MRRTSIITTILLIFVIIILVLALIVTNLPKDNNNISSTVSENNSETVGSVAEEKQDETPTYIDLNSDIVKDMYSILNDSGDLFHYLKKGYKTIEDFSNEDIQTVAYYYDAQKHVNKLGSIESFEDATLETKYMDEAVAKVFGKNVNYSYTFAYWVNRNANFLRYSQEDGLYHRYTGFGGAAGIVFNTAITEVREYSNRYEVVEKGVATVIDNNNVYSYFVTRSGMELPIGSVEDYSTLNVKKAMYSSKTYGAELVSNFEEGATEYKHVFMKNDDGTYYWVSSEIVK